MANLSFFFTLVGFLRRSQLLELRSALLFCSIIFFNWFPSTGIDGANMDRVEELAHVRRQAAAENQRDCNVGQSYCEKAIFGPKVLANKEQVKLRSPWRGCSQSLVLPTSPSEGKSKARCRAWRLRLHLDEAVSSRAEDGS